MSDILEYIEWRGDLSFECSSFNEIDALILSQISYLNFDGLFLQDDFSKKILLLEAAQIFKNSSNFEKRADTGLLINKLTVELFFKAAKTIRFGKIKITGYSSIIDTQKEEQFSALTYIINNKKNFIAYRGTDDTIVGWKEDFNLAILDEVPAQKDAVLYLEKAASKIHGKITLGGHSKGGNLAIYAASKVSNKIKNKIEIIYNHDGPGFSKSHIASKEFKSIIPKIRSYYPHLSIVGMIFSRAGKYCVVESGQSGIMQHDPFSWHLKGTSFILTEGFNRTSEFFRETFNYWLEHLDKAQREIFIETLFSIIKSTNVGTNSELSKNPIENSVKILKEIRKLNPENKAVLGKTVKVFFRIIHQKLPGFIKTEILLPISFKT